MKVQSTAHIALCSVASALRHARTGDYATKMGNSLSVDCTVPDTAIAPRYAGLNADGEKITLNWPWNSQDGLIAMYSPALRVNLMRFPRS